MNRHERGQGLVSYGLILVLVAITVILIQSLLGPAINAVFCESLTWIYEYDRVYYMDIGDEELIMDLGGLYASTLGDNCDIGNLEIMEYPSYGEVAQADPNGAFFIYRPFDIELGADDSFRYERIITGEYYTHIISISFDELNPEASTTSMMQSEPALETEIQYAADSIMNLWELASAQETKINEGADFVGKAIEKALKVLRDYAENQANQEFYEIFSQLIEEVKAGDFDGIHDVFEQPFTGLEEIPQEIRVNMIWKMAPRVIDSCQALSSGIVPQATIDSAIQAIVEIPDNHPGKEELLGIMEEVVDTIGKRNDFIFESTAYQDSILSTTVDLLEEAGEWDWAQKIATDRVVCVP